MVEKLVALRKAVECDNVEDVSAFLEENPTLAVSRDADGASLLHLTRSARMMRHLLSRQIDPNTQNARGWSPLFLSSYRRRFDIARVLIEAGCDTNLQTNEGDTALMVAVDNEDEQMVQLLLSHGAKPDIADVDGWTPLFVASLLDNVAIGDILLSYGANANAACCDSGETALHSAVLNESSSFVQLLLRHGARPDIPDRSGATARDCASQDAVREMVAQSNRIHGWPR